VARLTNHSSASSSSFGSEVAIRTCLTDLLWEIDQAQPDSPLLTIEALNTPALPPYHFVTWRG
jgi:hypothetical protein